MAKIALICSPGGHLTQGLSVAGDLAGEHDLFVCVSRFKSVMGLKLEETDRIYLLPAYWRYQMPFGVLASMLVSLWTFFRIFRRERPDVLITTGAEIAIPALLVNRLVFRRPSLYIESITRTEAPSLTGRLAWRLAHRVFVQWPKLLDYYGGRAEHHGRLL